VVTIFYMVALNIYGFSEWNLLLSPTILRWLLDFWKICVANYCEIWVCVDVYEADMFVCCDAVLFGRQVTTYGRHVLPCSG
jgi:hypothetical protein